MGLFLSVSIWPMAREGTSAFSSEFGAISPLSSGTRAAMDACLLLYLLGCVHCVVEHTSFHFSSHVLQFKMSAFLCCCLTIKDYFLSWLNNEKLS